MKLKRLKIKRKWWYIRKWRENPELDGEIDSDRYSIKIDDSIPQTDKELTLFHEIGHIVGDRHFSFFEQEDKYDKFITDFYEVLKKNNLLHIPEL